LFQARQSKSTPTPFNEISVHDKLLVSVIPTKTIKQQISGKNFTEMSRKNIGILKTARHNSSKSKFTDYAPKL